MMRRFLPVLALLGPVLIGSAAAERRDHERARAALEAGQIRPLSLILAEVERRFDGRVIEAELEFEQGQWRNEIKLLPPDGAVIVVEMDAVTGLLIRANGATPHA